MLQQWMYLEDLKSSMTVCDITSKLEVWIQPVGTDLRLVSNRTSLQGG